MVTKGNQCFRLQYTFFQLVWCLKHKFELWRVNLYRNDLKENKNFFELAEGWNYRRSRVFFKKNIYVQQ